MTSLYILIKAIYIIQLYPLYLLYTYHELFALVIFYTILTTSLT